MRGIPAPLAIGGAIPGATAGSILFAGVGGILAQKNAKLFWNDTLNCLGIGTATPDRPITIFDAVNTTMVRAITGVANALGSGAFFQGAQNSGVACGADTRLGGFVFGGAVDTAGTLNNACSMAAHASESWSSTACGSYMRFDTTLNGTNARAERMRIDNQGSVIVGTAAIATTATGGFLYVPASAGPPTGTPTAYTGRVPLHVDSTNSKFYAYIGGAWKSVTLA